MTTINTQDLTGPALDWAVEIAEGGELDLSDFWMHHRCFSNDPAQGHPIIERHRISLQHLGDRIGWIARWPAWVPDEDGETIPTATGPTALIAAMRCRVAARLGPTVDVPQELLP